ncbi:aminotransferase class V-fold PLP-dependent enzyme [Comamonas sp. JC664]|uniref:pyridoxal phosphate-dependent decarboxylase family protein n=1 Tax=Comamonas sp. JC664 TaxID=2801917 RepID=UPI00174A2BB6|nr:aminotransferase class V-fold PLP-dependent enzyme [Comamonas sp. JC664]MBL0696317.1 aminotransferase class V-fold PLP-dependent enzyme [Comamonas sp. JC664]GHG66449.1 L-2,4-diaminobutyrate decarboxylase [Comamonas sp. KCTC 72670]
MRDSSPDETARASPRDNWEQWHGALAQVVQVITQARQQAESRPVLTAEPSLREHATHPRPLPDEASALTAALQEAEALITAGHCNFAHPRYFGYVSPRPLLEPLLGDLLGNGLNQVPGAWRGGAGATVIEAETLAWLADFVGFPRGEGSLPGGIFVSGGTLANASALKLARDTVLGRHVQARGLTSLGVQPTFYLSREGHFSIWRGLDLLGLGRESVRLIEVDAAGRMDVSALEQQLARDLALGCKPVCIVGTAGTTPTGAVDPLDALARVARRHQLWFHVDGASGAALGTHPACAPLFTGLAQADSVTVDPCKWMFQHFGLGALLVRDGRELYKSFTATGHYWEELGELDLFQMSPYGTRQWRSLGLWLTLNHLGRHGLQALQGRLLDATQHLARRVREHAGLELLMEPTLPICCFRLRADTPEARNALNTAVQRAVVAEGHSYITLMDWRGDVYLRVAISNYVTEPRHLDEMLAAVLQQAHRVQP